MDLWRCLQHAHAGHLCEPGQWLLRNLVIICSVRFLIFFRIALLSSANYAYQSLGQFKEKFDRHIPSSGPVLVLVSSIVEMSVAADYYVNYRETSDSGREDWAVACGSISTFLCLVQLVMIFLRLSVAEMSAKVIGVFLVLQL